MSTAHDKTKRMPAVGSSTSGGPFLPAPAYAMPIDRLLSAAGGVSVEHGLSTVEVQKRYQQFGANQLSEAPREPTWRKLVAQFKDLVIWILIVAAIIAGVMGEWVDTAVILAIVFVNGIIGFLQEEKAGRALAALHKLSSPMAKVIRDGVLHLVPARELVPGDRIELEAGDNIPADARLLSGFGVRVQEAALTGESVPVDKDADCVLNENSPLGDRRNMVYMGTVTAAGKASAIVVAIGMDTELGHIAGLLQRSAPERTPLQRRLAELGKVLVFVCLVIVVVIFLLQLARGGELLEMLLISVSLAVAAVPEGLPAVVTLTLALGLQRMVKRNALVRKLPSVETLGSVTVICSDKTGTLTRNEMTVREIVTGGERFQVTGGGYAPHGQFLKCRDSESSPARAGQSTRRVRPHPSIDHGRALQQRDGQPARRRCRLLASHRRSDRGGAGRGRAQGGHRSSRPRTARPLRDSVRLGTQDDVSRAARVERHSRHAFQRCAGGDPRKVHRRATRRSSRAAHR